MAGVEDSFLVECGAHGRVRVNGLSIIRGLARHKLGRLHYVRATAQEAAATCKANHSNNRWDPWCQGGSSWYQGHVPEGYGTFEQFRNGNDFCMP